MCASGCAPDTDLTKAFFANRSRRAPLRTSDRGLERPFSMIGKCDEGNSGCSCSCRSNIHMMKSFQFSILRDGAAPSAPGRSCGSRYSISVRTAKTSLITSTLCSTPDDIPSKKRSIAAARPAGTRSKATPTLRTEASAKACTPVAKVKESAKGSPHEGSAFTEEAVLSWPRATTIAPDAAASPSSVTAAGSNGLRASSSRCLMVGRAASTTPSAHCKHTTHTEKRFVSSSARASSRLSSPQSAALTLMEC